MGWKWVVFSLVMMGAIPAQAAEINFSSVSDFARMELLLKDIDRSNPDEVELNVTLTPQAAERMCKITRESMKQSLTVLINGRRISTATVQSEVGGQFRIGVPRAIARDLLPTLID
ncbi:SecDF P1 head subdomain-containing protein [Pseudomonas sp. H11T01]|uniref:SecDF P1 head subdomain-containing protein n=1 Tax=Pseudomonas sp. H11T01 TaxID=3402749 RepID=UPI003AC942A3